MQVETIRKKLKPILDTVEENADLQIGVYSKSGNDTEYHIWIEPKTPMCRKFLKTASPFAGNTPNQLIRNVEEQVNSFARRNLKNQNSTTLNN